MGLHRGRKLASPSPLFQPRLCAAGGEAHNSRLETWFQGEWQSPDRRAAGRGLGARFVTVPLSLAGGSFRHFLWQVCKELQSSSLSLLLLCPSSAVNKNKVRGLHARNGVAFLFLRACV